VIPAGPLRERIAPGLARADAIVIIGDGPEPEGLADRRILRADLAPVGGGEFAGKTVAAFAGIGRPEKFFATLRSLGAVIAAAHEFPDHHAFRPAELAALGDEAARLCATLVTTSKDWVRLDPATRGGVAVVEVEIVWRDPAALAALLAPVSRDAAARP
jgi:tetraacyldisaccharide 4'-kinase